MIGEALIAIKALDSAFSLVKNSIDKSKDVAQMGSEIGKFMSAKAAVEKQMEEARKKGGDDVFSGSALEEAITLDAQEQRLAKMLDRIGKHYRTQGRTGAWIKIKNEAKKIEKAREKASKAKLKKAEQSDELLKDVLMIFAILVGGIAVTAGIIALLFGFSSE